MLRRLLHRRRAQPTVTVTVSADTRPMMRGLKSAEAAIREVADGPLRADPRSDHG